MPWRLITCSSLWPRTQNWEPGTEFQMRPLVREFFMFQRSISSWSGTRRCSQGQKRCSRHRAKPWAVRFHFLLLKEILKLSRDTLHMEKSPWGCDSVMQGTCHKPKCLQKYIFYYESHANFVFYSKTFVSVHELKNELPQIFV